MLLVITLMQITSSFFQKQSDIPTTGYLDLRTTHLHLYSRTRPSCPTSLMYGDLEQIKEYCGFHIYHTYLTLSVYRIDSDSFFLSNITIIEVSCQNSTDLMSIKQPQSVLNVQCGCTFSVNEMIFYSFSGACHNTSDFNDTFSPYYTANLLLLTEFFSILHALPSNHLLSDTFNISIPPLAIEKPEFKGRVARDKKNLHSIC